MGYLIMELTANNKKLQSRQKKRVIFYTLMFAIPMLQFLVFYLYANFNSFVLAFQKTDSYDYTVSFAGFKNFATAIKFFFSKESSVMIKNSFINYGFQLLLVTPLALIFSYYIAKGRALAGVFRVMLYLPSVISMVVLVILYKYMVNSVLPEIGKKFFSKEIPAYLTSSASAETQFKAVLFFAIWIAFGTNVMLYTGSMSAIDTSIIESAQLDGVNSIQEFIYIYVPMIFPTLTTFIVTGLAAIFSDQMNLFTFFGTGGKVSVFGYFFYSETQRNLSLNPGYFNMHELSALGLIITFILVPVILIVRKLLTKYGPSAD